MNGTVLKQSCNTSTTVFHFVHNRHDRYSIFRSEYAFESSELRSSRFRWRVHSCNRQMTTLAFISVVLSSQPPSVGIYITLRANFTVNWALPLKIQHRMRLSYRSGLYFQKILRDIKSKNKLRVSGTIRERQISFSDSERRSFAMKYSVFG